MESSEEQHVGDLRQSLVARDLEVAEVLACARMVRVLGCKIFLSFLVITPQLFNLLLLLYHLLCLFTELGTDLFRLLFQALLEHAV